MVSEFGVHGHFGPVAVGPMVVELYVMYVMYVMVENVKTDRSVMLHTDSPSLRKQEDPYEFKARLPCTARLSQKIKTSKQNP